jgi:hypothetical protein
MMPAFAVSRAELDLPQKPDSEERTHETHWGSEKAGFSGKNKVSSRKYDGQLHRPLWRARALGTTYVEDLFLENS